MSSSAASYLEAVERLNFGVKTGKLTAIHGGVLEASGCDVLLGELVEIVQARGVARIKAEVVGLRDNRILLMPFASSTGLCLNSRVVPLNKCLKIPTGEGLLGRVVDPLCQPLDELGDLKLVDQQEISLDPINPLMRRPIEENLHTGVKAIDVFCPLGRGQRIGVMAGSGVGKSTLMGMLAGNTEADVIVIALIGERGREVGDFINDSLREQGLKKSVVIAASAEQPAILRRQSAFTATAIAEWFRKKNKNVLLIMDSITRFAMAQREIGLSTGEPIGSRGYPSSVFSLLPPLIERGGAFKNSGTITSIYTVLVEGDDINEPITDHMRSLLDGHITLTRELAARNQYPAIDVLESISRLSNKLLDKEKLERVNSLRKHISLFRSSQDFIELGAYEKGTNMELDAAVELQPELDALFKQSPIQSSNHKNIWSEVSKVLDKS